MAIFKSDSPDSSIKLGKKLGMTLKPGDVVAYFGPMGAGKTTFTRGVAQSLGIDEYDVSSPTFSIVNSYEGRLNICHFDMYRIIDLDSLYSTGYFDYVDTDSVLLIEWSENIVDFLPENYIKVTFSYGSGVNERIIEISGGALDENPFH